jgi:hypothetical protein
VIDIGEGVRAATMEREEEERAALVPAADGCESDNTASMAVDKARRATEKPSWTRAPPTKGVGLVMGSLVVLALLIGGTTTSGWIPLGSYVSFTNAYVFFSYKVTWKRVRTLF